MIGVRAVILRLDAMVDGRIARWDGVTRRSTLRDEVVAHRDRIADAARDGDWPTVFGVLDKYAHWVDVNSARLEGRSGYTPLHQAAWHGTPVETVERLLALGAWRTWRAADGTRAVDIAAHRGHHHLTDVLRPEFRHPVPPDELALLQQNLHRLIRHRTGDGKGWDLIAGQGLRMPELEVLTELDPPALWFPVPSMLGGIRIVLRGRELIVHSSSRMDGDSGRTDRVMADGVYLQEGGWLP